MFLPRRHFAYLNLSRGSNRHSNNWNSVLYVKFAGFLHLTDTMLFFFRENFTLEQFCFEGFKTAPIYFIMYLGLVLNILVFATCLSVVYSRVFRQQTCQKCSLYIMSHSLLWRHIVLLTVGVYSSNHRVLYTIGISMTRRFQKSVGPSVRL